MLCELTSETTIQQKCKCRTQVSKTQKVHIDLVTFHHRPLPLRYVVDAQPQRIETLTNFPHYPSTRRQARAGARSAGHRNRLPGHLAAVLHAAVRGSWSLLQLLLHLNNIPSCMMLSHRKRRMLC